MPPKTSSLHKNVNRRTGQQENDNNMNKSMNDNAPYIGNTRSADYYDEEQALTAIPPSVRKLTWTDKYFDTRKESNNSQTVAVFDHNPVAEVRFRTKIMLHHMILAWLLAILPVSGILYYYIMATAIIAANSNATGPFWGLYVIDFIFCTGIFAIISYAKYRNIRSLAYARHTAISRQGILEVTAKHKVGVCRSIGHVEKLVMFDKYTGAHKSDPDDYRFCCCPYLIKPRNLHDCIVETDGGDTHSYISIKDPDAFVQAVMAMKKQDDEHKCRNIISGFEGAGEAMQQRLKCSLDGIASTLIVPPPVNEGSTQAMTLSTAGTSCPPVKNISCVSSSEDMNLTTQETTSRLGQSYATRDCDDYDNAKSQTSAVNLPIESSIIEVLEDPKNAHGLKLTKLRRVVLRHLDCDEKDPESKKLFKRALTSLEVDSRKVVVDHHNWVASLNRSHRKKTNIVSAGDNFEDSFDGSGTSISLGDSGSPLSDEQIFANTIDTMEREEAIEQSSRPRREKTSMKLPDGTKVDKTVTYYLSGRLKVVTKATKRNKDKSLTTTKTTEVTEPNGSKSSISTSKTRPPKTARKREDA